MIMDDSWYMDWYMNQASPEDKRLVEKVIEFGEMFEDMLFQEGTSTYELLKCKSKPPGSDRFIDDTFEPPDELEYFSYTFFHFKVEPIVSGNGFFMPSAQLLTVTPESLEKDDIILHEMIHLHEYVLNSLPLYLHDMVYWALYKDLKNKIPDLDYIITSHANLLRGTTIYISGGLHDILFLLKSFDLDIKMGYPLGTVFAYGRVEELKNFSYIKEDLSEAPVIYG